MSGVSACGVYLLLCPVCKENSATSSISDSQLGSAVRGCGSENQATWVWLKPARIFSDTTEIDRESGNAIILL
jgi:hypothetical protein